MKRANVEFNNLVNITQRYLVSVSVTTDHFTLTIYVRFALQHRYYSSLNLLNA